MPRYELLIAVVDEDDLLSGHKRKKEGDIVCVRPYPQNWGLKDIADYLVVIVESVEDLATMKRFTIEHYEDGTEWPPGEENEDWHFVNPPKILAKHRYSIPLSKVQDEIPDLDLGKVRDKTCRYQPCKKLSKVLERLDGKDGRRLLKKEDVEARTVLTGDESEVVIDFSSKKICFDKHRKLFIAKVKNGK